MKKTANIFYSGIVQGVGFRYTVHRYASGLGLCGFVRNLSDGRVEVLVEGEEATIQKLIEGIDSHFDGSIKNKVLNYSPFYGQYSEFNITF